MDSILRMLVVEPVDVGLTAAVAHALPTRGRRPMRVERVEDVPAVLHELSRTHVDALLLDLRAAPEEGLQALRAMGPATAQCAVLVLVAEGADDGDDAEDAPGAATPTIGDLAISAGAKDIITPNVLTEGGLGRIVRRAVERQRVHGALRTQVDILHAILTTIPEAVLVVAPDGSVRLCNPAGRALLDFAGSALAVSGPLRADPTLLDRAAAGAYADGIEVECGGDSRAEHRHYEVTLRPLRAGDQPLGGLIVLRDETKHHDVDARIRELNRDLARSLDERTEALRVAEEANRLKLKFLEAVSHELRTPLTPILGFTRLLLRRPAGEMAPEDRETLELVYDNANRLLRVVDGILDFQALQRRTMTIDPAPTALAPLLAEVAQSARAALTGGPVQVVVDTDPNVPEIVMCDGRRLAQIAHRLMENAVAHTERGEIRVIARWEDGRLRFAVRDTGVGIASEHQSRIFLAFYQVDPGTGPGHGVGLGLAYGQLLAQAMGGTIQVQSELGRGSEFTVEVPAPRPDASLLPGTPLPLTFRQEAE